MWREYLIVWIVLCMSVVGKYLTLKSFWTFQGARVYKEGDLRGFVGVFFKVR